MSVVSTKSRPFARVQDELWDLQHSKERIRQQPVMNASAAQRCYTVVVTAYSPL